jgi:CRISPR-associated protein Csb2
MITIKMYFLVGRFHATPWGHHVNEGVVEYPPSLWRFLRSLTAVYYRTLSEEFSEESLVRILDILSNPPEFNLPTASIGHTRHYDVGHGTVETKAGTSKLKDIPFFFDTFVSINPKAEIIWRWREAILSDEDQANLAKLLKNLGTFGRSESWCEAKLIDNEPEIGVFKSNSYSVSEKDSTFRKETIRLLLPNVRGKELLERLLIDTSTMRGKDKQLEPNGSRWVTYSRPSNVLTPRRIASPKMSKTKLFTVARFALAANVLPLVTSSLPFAELARRCLIRNRGFRTEHSEVITGKTADGTPLLNHQHAHYLATSENEDNIGHIDHLTIFAPRGFDKGDIAALGEMRSINWRDSRTGIRLILIGLGEAKDFAMENKKVSLFQKPLKSCKFRSVTPFSLPYYPTRGGGKAARPKDSPEGQLLRELRKRGLPAPVAVKEIKGFYEKYESAENMSEETPRFRWLEFTYRRFNGTAGNGLAGFEIEFAEEDLDKLEVPLTLGFGCHFGLGLFLPVDEIGFGN